MDIEEFRSLQPLLHLHLYEDHTEDDFFSLETSSIGTCDSASDREDDEERISSSPISFFHNEIAEAPIVKRKRGRPSKASKQLELERQRYSASFPQEMNVTEFQLSYPTSDQVSLPGVENPPKRKRGRPKKNPVQVPEQFNQQATYSGTYPEDHQLNEGILSSSPVPIFLSGSPIGSPPHVLYSSGFFSGNNSNSNSGTIIPVKRGRGRPRKSSLTSGMEGLLTPMSSMNLSQQKLPNDYEICEYIKDFIVKSNRCGTTSSVTPDVLLTNLEEHFMVSLRSRQNFLFEVFSLLSV